MIAKNDNDANSGDLVVVVVAWEWTGFYHVSQVKE